MPDETVALIGSSSVGKSTLINALFDKAIQKTADVRKVSTVYRKRFAIESSYRMKNIVKLKTSSKNAIIRYFYALISFLLKNTWLYIQKKHFTIVKRGPQVIGEDKFRFEVFILLIEKWLRQKLRVRTVVRYLR
jgi:putative transposase